MCTDRTGRATADAQLATCNFDSVTDQFQACCRATCLSAVCSSPINNSAGVPPTLPGVAPRQVSNKNTQ
eukprot:1046556-Pyramimonas_sp.AAC.1